MHQRPKTKTPAEDPTGVSNGLCKTCLLLDNVAGLKLTVLTSRDVEGNCCSLVKGLESIHLNLREVNEQIFAILLRDEAITLLRIEPFYSTFSHANSSFLSPPQQGKNLANGKVPARMPSLRKRIQLYATFAHKMTVPESFSK